MIVPDRPLPAPPKCSSSVSKPRFDSESGIENELSLEAPKTRLLAAKLKELDLDSVLILNEAFDEKVFLAARNLPNVGICDAASMDPVVLIRFEKVLVTVPALKLIEERLS